MGLIFTSIALIIAVIVQWKKRAALSIIALYSLFAFSDGYLTINMDGAALTSFHLSWSMLFMILISNFRPKTRLAITLMIVESVYMGVELLWYLIATIDHQPNPAYYVWVIECLMFIQLAAMVLINDRICSYLYKLVILVQSLPTMQRLLQR